MIPDENKHLDDKELFTHVKFSSLIFGQATIEDKYGDDVNTFTLRDVSMRGEEPGYVFNRVFHTIQVLEEPLTVKKPHSFKTDLIKILSDIEKEPAKKSAKLKRIVELIESGKKISVDDVAAISWVWYEVYDAIVFTPLEYRIPKIIKNVLNTVFNRYLSNFIDDKLSKTKKNYYKFEKQKETLIKIIEEDKKIKLYGNNFIIKEKINRSGLIERVPDFCLIHTVYALQKMGYLKVIDVWEETDFKGNYFTEDHMIRHLCANILLEQVFVDEIYSAYKKDNPKNIIDKFDKKKAILSFAGKQIEISKNGKETDAVLLLETLLNKNNEDWAHNDEIFTGWGYTEDDQKKIPKNKIYFAGQKINNAIAIKTGIDDLIDCSTTKARINPKYRKIDE